MMRRPGTGLPVSPNGGAILANLSLMVCGESPNEVFGCADQVLSEWRSENLTWGYREFFVRRYFQGERSFNLLVGGLGSASVEILMQEAVLSGSKRFVLTGSSGSLNREIPVGSLTIPKTVLLRPGAFSEYHQELDRFEVSSPLTTSLERFLDHHSGVDRVHSVTQMSTDAFYAIGASRDATGRACYAGAPGRWGRLPASLPLALENQQAIDTLDMECATFHALGRFLDGVETCTFKIVSNMIPWADDFTHDSITHSLHQVLSLALGFVESEADSSFIVGR